MRCGTYNPHRRFIGEPVIAEIDSGQFTNPLASEGEADKIRHRCPGHKRSKVSFLKSKEFFKEMNSLPFNLWCNGVVTPTGILIVRTHQPIACDRRWSR